MKPVTIIGGGLAGLTLGILLRREHVPVTLFEAGAYPRHRVCGEFVSGRARGLLRALQLESIFKGAREGRTSAFFLGAAPALEWPLPEPALCLSRFELDAALAQLFSDLGGDLRAGERFAAATDAPGVVRASGRHRSPAGQGHLFGLKAHALNCCVKSDLEMHFGRNQYVGLCRLPGGRVNVCGLFYSAAPVRNLQKEWPNILSSAVETGALKDAQWDADSFCAVAGLELGPVADANGFAIGDAAGMLPPLTGNGMSMAFESAAGAVAPLLEYAAGALDWDDACRAHREKWKGQFARRLRWAGFLQNLIFRRGPQRALFSLARTFPAFPKLLFGLTR